MSYDVKTFRLTENGMVPLDYFKSEHFIEQDDAAILLNDIFVKQYRNTYGEIIGVILHSAKKEKLPDNNSNNKGVLGVLCK